MAVQRSGEVTVDEASAPVALLLESLRVYWRAGDCSDAEAHFESRNSLNWQRVQHCLLFPADREMGGAFYSSTLELRSSADGQLHRFYRRAPGCRFALTNMGTIARFRRVGALAGIYSYGNYLDDGCNTLPGLLLAHYFAPKALGEDRHLHCVRSLIKNQTDLVAYAERQDAELINLCICVA